MKASSTNKRKRSDSRQDDLNSFDSTLGTTVTSTTYLDIPQEIWQQISSYLEYRKTNLHQVNRWFFKIILDYDISHIAQKGISFHLDLLSPVGPSLQGTKISFNRKNQEFYDNIPNYVWRRLTRRVKGIPASYNHSFFKSLKKTHISIFNFSDINMDDESVITLAQALSDSQSKELYLAHNNIGPKGAKALAQALPYSQIEVLNLNWNEIGDQGAEDFAQALPYSQIKMLNLLENKILKEGATLLINALQQSKIEELNLSHNNIGSENTKKLDAYLLTKKQVKASHS